MEQLKQLRLHVDLVYAPDKSKVEFEALKKEPLEWLSEASDDSIVLQIRVKILSSQVQNTLFRLHIEARDASGEAVYAAYTEPIKVVSKPDQIRKKRAAVGESEDIPTSKRRARGEEILEYIQHARDTQEKNLQLIESLIQTPQSPASSVGTALKSLANSVQAHAAPEESLDTALGQIPSEDLDTLIQYVLPALQRASEKETTDSAGEDSD